MALGLGRMGLAGCSWLGLGMAGWWLGMGLANRQHLHKRLLVVGRKKLGG
jgi:hypothetical protein